MSFSKVIFLTSGTTWIVPGDWNSASNQIEAIGGGGAGGGQNGLGTTKGGGGGGGGAYAIIPNFSSTPGTSIPIVVGAGGTGISGSSGQAGTVALELRRGRPIRVAVVQVAVELLE